VSEAVATRPRGGADLKNVGLRRCKASDRIDDKGSKSVWKKRQLRPTGKQKVFICRLAEGKKSPENPNRGRVKKTGKFYESIGHRKRRRSYAPLLSCLGGVGERKRIAGGLKGNEVESGGSSKRRAFTRDKNPPSAKRKRKPLEGIKSGLS